MILLGMGSVKGSVTSGRDAVLVSMGSSAASATAAGDVVVMAFDGISSPASGVRPSYVAGGSSIVISGAAARAQLTAVDDAILVAFDGASGSTVTGGGFAAAVTGGSGNNLNVAGDDGAFAWTYGGYSGSVTSSDGSAVAAALGNISEATIHGKEDAFAITVGSFSGTVTADQGYAGVISLLNATGTVTAGKGALIASDGVVNATAEADEDLVVWARGNVLGSYSAGRDAAVVSHGTLNASLTADRDIVFAYGGDGLRGSLTAGRWIGDGSTSVPNDPTIIDNVFSHGEILAQILAGTSASSDPDKGRIGTIGSIGNAGGEYTANSIGRIRTAGFVTATLHTSSGDYAGGSWTGGSGGSGGTGGTIIQENQTTLITSVPEPQLDPSERDQILADASAAKAEAVEERTEIIVELNLWKAALQVIRQQILNVLAELRAEIRAKADALHPQIDAAVDVAQATAKGSLTLARWVIEGLYLLREARYLAEQRGWEQFRDTSKDILNEAVKVWAEEIALAVKAFEQFHQQIADEKARRIAEADAHKQAHYNRYEDELAKTRQMVNGSSMSGETFLNYVQGTLDVAGFIPGVGAVPDLINAAISAGRGNYGEAMLNLALAVPFLEYGVKAGKMMAKGAGKADEVAGVVNSVTKNADGAADEVLGASDEVGGPSIVRDGQCFLPGQLVHQFAQTSMRYAIPPNDGANNARDISWRLAVALAALLSVIVLAQEQNRRTRTPFRRRKVVADNWIDLVFAMHPAAGWVGITTVDTVPQPG